MASKIFLQGVAFETISTYKADKKLENANQISINICQTIGGIVYMDRQLGLLEPNKKVGIK